MSDTHKDTIRQIGPVRVDKTAIINLERGKLPPQAMDLEEAVLGAMLIDKKGADDCFMVIKSADVFYKDAHKHIFEAIQSLYANSEGIDLMTVSQRLRERNLLDTAGGDFYLIGLSQRISSSAHIEFHSRILLQYYIKRRIIMDAAQLVAVAYDEDKDALELLEQWGSSQDSIAQLTMAGQKEKTFAAGLQDARAKVEFLTHKDASEITGVSTGFGNADAFTSGWQPQDLIIYAARPGMGKTSVMLSGVLAEAKAGHAVGVISAEMSHYQLTTRTIAMDTNFHMVQLTKKGFEKNEYFITLDSHIRRMSAYGIHIDDTASPDISHVQAKARYWKRKYNIRSLKVDYLQLIRDVSVKGNREQEIANISRKLKALAKELDIPVIALSQLSRAVESRGSSKRPMLSDLRESGAIEQDADAVVFIYRPGYYLMEPDDDIAATGGDSELIFAKYRGGAPGTSIPLKWIGDKTKYIDPAEYHQYEPMATNDNWESVAQSRTSALPTPTAQEAFGNVNTNPPEGDIPF